MSLRSLLIYGTGGHSKVVHEVALALGYQDILHFDDLLPSDSFCAFTDSFRGNLHEMSKYPGSDVHIALGNPKLRASYFSQLRSQEFSFPPLIHPTAFVSPSTQIEQGAIIMPYAFINSHSVIGPFSIVNTRALVEHDCILKQFVHVAPDASVAGGVHIGSSSFLGLRSVISNNVSIGEFCTVGAGSVVVRDVMSHSTVVGVPARIV